MEDRKRFLDYFCKKVALAPYLYYSDTFQLLVRNKGADIEKADVVLFSSSRCSRRPTRPR